MGKKGIARRIVILAIVTVVVIAGIIGVIYYLTLPSGPSAPPGLAQISGTVTDKNTGLPVEGAKVTVNGNVTFTDSDGFYSIDLPLAPYAYTIIVEKEGYGRKTKTRHVSEERVYTFDFVITPAFTNVYLDPSEIALSEVPVGHRFNVTARVFNVTDLFGYQVLLYYNASVINMTQAWLPPDHVLAGQMGIPLGPYLEYFDSWGVGFLGWGCLPGVTPFSGDGKLAVFEFEVVASPPEGGTLTSDLVISYVPPESPHTVFGEQVGRITKLKDPTGGSIAFTATDGSYEYVG